MRRVHNHGGLLRACEVSVAISFHALLGHRKGAGASPVTALSFMGLMASLQTLVDHARDWLNVRSIIHVATRSCCAACATCAWVLVVWY